MSIGALYYPNYAPGLGSRPRLQSHQPFRHLISAGSNQNNQWSGSSGQSGYGLEPPDYDYHSGPPSHVPSGGSYSYHATTGTGYGPPAAPAVHPPAKPTGGGKKGILGGLGSGKKGSSAMSALTLLSFLFFINLLQGCIKDHMDAINPTVMVMTTNVIRNRFNKMGEMNSREQGHSSNAANIVMQPADLVAAAAAQAPIDSSRPVINSQSPFNGNPSQILPSPSYAPLPPPQPPHQYVHTTPETDIPIKYPRPYYDPHKPDTYDQLSHLPPPQHTLNYYNQTLVQQPPPYKIPNHEQHYTFHHTEYSAQPAPQPTFIAPQYSMSQNPLYEPHNNDNSKPYSENSHAQYGGLQNDYNYRQKYENSPYHAAPEAINNKHPWSSNQQSSSVVSGPFRRASIIAVAPKTKWISVPAKITDQTYDDAIVEDVEEEMEHHDDRDVFRSGRFNRGFH